MSRAALVYRLLAATLPAFTGLLFFPLIENPSNVASRLIALALGTLFACLTGFSLQGAGNHQNAKRWSRALPIITAAFSSLLAVFFSLSVYFLKPAFSISSLIPELVLLSLLHFIISLWTDRRSTLLPPASILAALLSSILSVELCGWALSGSQLVLCFAAALFTAHPAFLLHSSFGEIGKRLHATAMLAGPFIISGLCLGAFLPRVYFLITAATLSCFSFLSTVAAAEDRAAYTKVSTITPLVLWVAAVVARLLV